MQTEIADAIFEKIKGLPVGDQKEILQIVEQKLSASQERNARPIWELIAEMSAEIPDEIWAELPTDGSINHDHYLYGAPKKKV